MNMVAPFDREGQVSTDAAGWRERDVTGVGAEVPADAPVHLGVAGKQKHIASHGTAEPTVAGADNHVTTHAPAVVDLQGLYPPVEVALHSAAQVHRLGEGVQ